MLRVGAQAFEPSYEALNASAGGLDSNDDLPREQWATVCETGLTRLPFGPEWDGHDLSLAGTMQVLEDFGYRCRLGGLAFALTTHITSTGIPLQRFGSPELKERYLRAVCSGDAIGAHAITDPDSGSDVLNMSMTASPDAGDWLLDGEKLYVTNAPVASLLVVYAMTDRALGPFGLSAFLVERDLDGVSVGPPVAKMGLHGAPFGTVSFDRCRVPGSNIIGQPGMGFTVLDYVMKWEVLCSFSVTLGQMVHRMERCLDYAKERRSFGRPIGTYQAVADQIVAMKIGVETTRDWLARAARSFSEGHPEATMDVAIAKLTASEANLASALSAVQIFGGRGYLSETGLEADLRDAVAGTIYSGTSEVQRTRIARMLGLPGPEEKESPA